jgi:hypothetical protein
MTRIHVIPVGAGEPVHTAAESCFCSPLVTNHSYDKIVIHHATDNREARERHNQDKPADSKWVTVGEEISI